jgi:fibronectin type 3 domain-containing protein
MMKKLIIYLFLLQFVQNNITLSAQEYNVTATPIENFRAKGFVTDKNEIKLRWSPGNTRAWSDGIKYGYTVKRYTVMIDNRWQETPGETIFVENLKPRALADWEEYANKSDYAAVIAQAFYGEDFELSASGNNDIGSIINQANELEQRFSTSVFMAEYDYKAAVLAGWAWTDNTVKDNERYLYRIYLNRPERLQGDTAAVYLGLEDKKELPKPIGLNALFGDKTAMLSWNYTLLSDTYHSYHIERKEEGGTFKRITELPVTALDGEMKEIFYTDSLTNNETVYTYRVTGLTGFDETGPCSEEVSGKGEKALSCIPYIYSGDFIGKDRAKIYWEFECEDSSLIDKFSLSVSKDIDGEYQSLLDNIPLDKRELDFPLTDARSYVKLQVKANDGRKTESFPFLLRQVDSIPPAVPTGLKVGIDSTGVARLSWVENQEPDLLGYRILRSFTENEEKSSVTPEFITRNHYADTLSLDLGNSYVYYSLTAIDERYNESAPCMPVKAVKPNNKTPDEPVITGYKLLPDNKVAIEWTPNPGHPDITYKLIRTNFDNPEYTRTVFSGDYNTTSYSDEIPVAGKYRYSLVAYGADGKKSFSPQPLEIEIKSNTASNEVSGLTYYADSNKGYIELSWKKHEKAKLYRIYKATEDEKMALWKELEPDETRVTDENVSAGNNYTYTILYITDEGRPSKTKTIVVNY